MKKSVELPLVEPLYSTYHYQGNGAAVIKNNPSIRNWYLNRVMMLHCSKKFLSGFTTPEISVAESSNWDNPYLEQLVIPMKYLGGNIHATIRALLDDEYYVGYFGVDDFYVEGKSFYKERHFFHDGMICGYDQNEGTYTLYAYDESWVYRAFKTSQKGFEAGRKAAFRKGEFGEIFAIKAKADYVELDPLAICQKMNEYLDSSLEKYPIHVDEVVYGSAVHDYLAMYLEEVASGKIPYDRVDRRVFRLIWEHKKVMSDRIIAMENALLMDTQISKEYQRIVQEANALRMGYASYCAKKRDSLLPSIQKRLLSLSALEREILSRFVQKAEGGMGS